MTNDLEEVSPWLANFSEKGIELPGQYLVLDTVITLEFFKKYIIGTFTLAYYLYLEI